MPDLDGWEAWKKSSFSATGDCVEVRLGVKAVQVRDSKDPEGAQLEFSRTEWVAFLKGLEVGEFGLPSAKA